tara:strand:+ start:2602 stop:3696 length:1095 start_codon:yes stop_codon:yes gene_type:complete
MKIILVVGARPNFIKIAPILEQMQSSRNLHPYLLHTGQHYDKNMSYVFFDQLGIRKPNMDLGVGSGSNSWQLSEISQRFDLVLKNEKPGAVLVVGDVNSTVACSLVAAYHQTPVAHVEAGLRSFDLSMPEEINRVVTDRLSTLLFSTEPSGKKNLMNEGVASGKIHFVGNVMVDTLIKSREIAEKDSDALGQYGLEKDQYAMMTLHRAANVNRPELLKNILTAVGQLATKLPVVFSIHPRTQKQIESYELESLLNPLTTTPPLPYLDSLKLMSSAKMVLTDSGGIQEETTLLGIPCLTFRKNTERPVTLDEGTNILVGEDMNKLKEETDKILEGNCKTGRIPELWDGNAAKRIVHILDHWAETK